MKKILLTGTSGFLGGNFLNSIIKNKVTVLDILREKNKNNKYLENLRKENKNYKSIFFKNSKDLKKKIKNKKFDVFINFATYYKNSHHFHDIENIINSNISFPTNILDIVSSKIKFFINFGTMMEYDNKKKFSPLNLYASSKKAFEKIINYYEKNNKNCSFYNIKIYETFNIKDAREKILPTILRSFLLKKKFNLAFKNLKINVVHTSDINNFLKKIINDNVKPGNYLLKNKREIKILKLLQDIKKLDCKNFVYSVNNTKIIKKKIKKYENLKTIELNYDVCNEILSYLNENNKNKNK